MFPSHDREAFLGLGQLKKLKNIVDARNKNYNLYRKLLSSNMWTPPKNTNRKMISNFAYPLITDKRDDIVSTLNKNNIAVRPLICGSLAKQPFWTNNFNEVELKNANSVDCHGLYLPNNHEISEEEIETICSLINEEIDNEIT